MSVEWHVRFTAGTANFPTALGDAQPRDIGRHESAICSLLYFVSDQIRGVIAIEVPCSLGVGGLWHRPR